MVRFLFVAFGGIFVRFGCQKGAKIDQNHAEFASETVEEADSLREGPTLSSYRPVRCETRFGPRTNESDFNKNSSKSGREAVKISVGIICPISGPKSTANTAVFEGMLITRFTGVLRTYTNIYNVVSRLKKVTPPGSPGAKSKPISIFR